MQSPKELVNFDIKVDSLLNQEAELFQNQQDTMVVAFDTILRTLKNNQSRILSLEESLFCAYDEIDILNEKLKKQEDEWRQIVFDQEVELKKASIKLDYLVPERIKILEEKIVYLQELLAYKEERFAIWKSISLCCRL